MSERDDTCAVEDCERPKKRVKSGRITSKWCAGHAMRVYRYGHPQADIPLASRAPSEIDIEAKRLDSLARNRASAELKRRHPEEWEEIRKRIHNELQVERTLVGEVTRSRNEPVHVDAGDGTCEACGKKAPCEPMRERERLKEARKENPVPTPDE